MHLIFYRTLVSFIILLLSQFYKSKCEAVARPDIAELDVFLGQHILLTLEQHLNPKI